MAGFSTNTLGVDTRLQFAFQDERRNFPNPSTPLSHSPQFKHHITVNYGDYPLWALRNPLLTSYVASRSPSATPLSDLGLTRFLTHRSDRYRQHALNSTRQRLCYTPSLVDLWPYAKYGQCIRLPPTISTLTGGPLCQNIIDSHCQLRGHGDIVNGSGNLLTSNTMPFNQ